MVDKGGYNDFYNLLLQAERAGAEQFIAMRLGSAPPLTVIEEVIVPALTDIGEGWEEGTVSLAQVYMASRICEQLVESLLSGENCIAPKETPPIAIVTLADYHSLGKRIVSAFLHSHGYRMVDFGHGLTVEEVIEAVKRHGTEILLLSTLILNSALAVKDLVDKFQQAHLSVRVIVGGAPFNLNRKLWAYVGAHAMATNASDAVQVLERVIASPDRMSTMTPERGNNR
ncbi:cobalamin B12-binding domain-containing protein [Heliophilum fasciatum]|uniref:Methanogenic corrinoid protein MtbC1 n=1 Tax=Heliophilum fasciatum TaxID=35700 RepID=A0A4R2RIY8_9FIRM|nr:cobalamin-dependent protein [Heliophilum fasciatum]MCW2278600.1 methanogenic corrinoid protein MtbC1 [Heliophilum fasciatum]TCP62698.1 methanogenic corrinoid protein MtbC1 [Heliophilum fasciatum]